MDRDAACVARRNEELIHGHFHFELVSPEKLLFSGEVDQVDVPGAEGDFGVLAGHAPLVATLRPGILTVHRAGGAQRIVVLGGFAEVSAAGPDRARRYRRAGRGLRPRHAREQIERDRGNAATTEAGSRSTSSPRVDQLKTLQTELTHGDAGSLSVLSRPVDARHFMDIGLTADAGLAAVADASQRSLLANFANSCTTRS